MSKNLLNSNTYTDHSTTISISLGSTSTVKNKQLAEKEIKKATRIYGESWIVMQNRLIHAISDLEIHQRRLVLFLSPIVRKSMDENPNNNLFVVNANEFAKAFDLKGNHHYQLVRDAALALQDKSFWFWDFHRNDKVDYRSKVSWIGKSTPIEHSSLVEITLLDDVIEMLSVFDRLNPYTKYHKDLIMNLDRDGMVMLELVASFEDKRSKQAVYSVEYIREKFGRTESYPKVNDLKRKVLDKAIQQLEDHTPYHVKIQPQANKGGREITDFVFEVQKDIVPVEIVVVDEAKPKKIYKKGLSDKQLAKLSHNKDKFVELNQNLVTDKSLDNYQAFEFLKPLLQDVNTVNDFIGIDELLSVQKGEVVTNINKNSKADKNTKKQPYKSAAKLPTLTADQIKIIAANIHFQYDYPVKGKDTGSAEHIEYLEFRLGSSATEFTKKPLSTYLD